ncbi:MAG: O-antigen ligase family protein [Geminicoccaceae bacterium]|nr:O-antigen ligase family protein [Geminicoccaceae bacterium]
MMRSYLHPCAGRRKLLRCVSSTFLVDYERRQRSISTMRRSIAPDTFVAPVEDTHPRRRRATPAVPPLSRLDGFLFAALAVLLAALPWPLGANRPWAWSALFLAGSAFLLLLGATLVLGLARAPRLPGTVRLALVLVAAVVGWILVQSGPAPWPELAHPIWALLPTELAARPAIAIDPPRAREALLRLLGPLALLAVAYVLGSHRAASERLVRLLLILITAQAAFAFLRIVVGWDELFGRALPLERISGSFVNPNHFAAYVNLGAVIAFLLLLDQARRDADSPRLGASLSRLLTTAFQSRPLLAAALMSCLLAVAASASRGGALALGLTLLILIAAGLRGARLPLLLAGLGLLAALVGWAVSAGGELLWQRLVDLDPKSAFSPGIEGRLLAWAWTLERIAERPWLGHGYGGFMSLFEHARDARFPTGGPWDYAHNTYLELAVELGIPAAAALALAVLLCLVPCMAAIRRGTSSPLPAIALGATLVQALHALVDFGWQIPAVTATWAALLGAAVGRSAATLERAPARRRRASSQISESMVPRGGIEPPTP